MTTCGWPAPRRRNADTHSRDELLRLNVRLVHGGLARSRWNCTRRMVPAVRHSDEQRYVAGYVLDESVGRVVYRAEGVRAMQDGRGGDAALRALLDRIRVRDVERGCAMQRRVRVTRHHADGRVRSPTRLEGVRAALASTERRAHRQRRRARTRRQALGDEVQECATRRMLSTSSRRWPNSTLTRPLLRVCVLPVVASVDVLRVRVSCSCVASASAVGSRVCALPEYADRMLPPTPRARCMCSCRVSSPYGQKKIESSNRRRWDLNPRAQRA
jgi:hypothetical protein